MSASLRRPAGFTLVEILVVIGIIVLLAALAFPAYRSTINSAKSAEAVSNLKQIGVMVGNYAADNGNRLPPGRQSGTGFFFQQMLAQHAGLWRQGQTPGLPEVFFDPCLNSNPLPQHPFGSFGVNTALVPVSTFQAQGSPMVTIANPSQKVIMASTSPGLISASYSSSWMLEGAKFAQQGISASIFAPDPRNAGAAASLFVDGHVERLDVKNMDKETRERYFAP
jgi:prepilin-type N-terminal cleavage/methylation domain-containing protein/prepilin-type processing-associated H-X9-DG protein